MFTNPPDDVIRALLARRLNVAVVGCSPKSARDSHRIARLLLDRGHRIFPVNPSAGPEILGQKVYADVRDIPARVDMVDIFRRSDQVASIVDAAIEKGVNVVWMQLDVIDEVAAARAQRAGLTVVMDRCPAIEYRRLFAT
jgi:uncharacterized protein